MVFLFNRNNSSSWTKKFKNESNRGSVMLNGDVFGVQNNANKDQDLAGVGIVFRKAPDESLIVKSLVEGSAAWSSGIKCGDTLWQVDGKSVYCKGLDVCTNAILGPVGTVVHLKFARVENGHRMYQSVALLRELKATSDPQFKIRQSGINMQTTTSQVYLECMIPDQTPASPRPDSPPQAPVRSVDINGNLPPRPETDRKVKFEGKWYTEAQIREMEAAARNLQHQIREIEEAAELEGGASESSEAGWHGGGIGANTPPRNASPVEAESEDPTTLPAMMAVVTGGVVYRERAGGKISTSVKRTMGMRWKETKLKMSTGGEIFWGEECGGRVMGAKRCHEQYDPSMDKAEFENLHKKFVILVEGEQVLAHCSGGAITACQGIPVELIARSIEERDQWVKGINALLKKTRLCSAGGTSSLNPIVRTPEKQTSSKIISVNLPSSHRNTLPAPLNHSSSMPSHISATSIQAQSITRTASANATASTVVLLTPQAPPSPVAPPQSDSVLLMPEPSAPSITRMDPSTAIPNPWEISPPVLDDEDIIPQALVDVLSATDSLLGSIQADSVLEASNKPVATVSQSEGKDASVMEARSVVVAALQVVDEDEDDDEIARLAGMTMSRVTCFEQQSLADKVKTKTPVDLQEQWGRTANYISSRVSTAPPTSAAPPSTLTPSPPPAKSFSTPPKPSGPELVKCSPAGFLKSPSKLGSSGRGEGDLSAVMAARLKAQRDAEENDDGYYF